MGYERLIQLTSEALVLCLVLSLPAVLVAAIVGLFISFVQAVTSLQDQSISQGVKLLAVTVVVAIAAPWAGSTVVRFSEQLFKAAFA